MREHHGTLPCATEGLGCKVRVPANDSRNIPNYATSPYINSTIMEPYKRQYIYIYICAVYIYDYIYIYIYNIQEIKRDK